jgi:hypothetical protein
MVPLRMDVRELVAWNLRRIRVLRDLSQEKLGADADVDRTYVGRLERRLGGVLINETARVPVDGPVHHRSPPRRVQVVPATAIIPK